MTPLESYPDLATALGIPAIYFKREDLHPYGSHKGRSIPVMIDHYVQKGERAFAISSSGNAALAAALHIAKINTETNTSDPLTLDIFAGNHVSPSKLERIREIADKHTRILIKERPLQALSQVAQEGVCSLRQSTDDEALTGYVSLAEELIAASKENPIGAIFIGSSSGTTAQALATYVAREKSPIQVHIVQTASCHPLSDAFETYEGPEERSIADAITDIVGHRRDALTPLIEASGGTGWFATNDDIRGAQELAETHAGLTLSTNSALSLVGAMKAAYTGLEINGAFVCIITGQ